MNKLAQIMTLPTLLAALTYSQTSSSKAAWTITSDSGRHVTLSLPSQSWPGSQAQIACEIYYQKGFREAKVQVAATIPKRPNAVLKETMITEAAENGEMTPKAPVWTFKEQPDMDPVLLLAEQEPTEDLVPLCLAITNGMPQEVARLFSNYPRWAEGPAFGNLGTWTMHIGRERECLVIHNPDATQVFIWKTDANFMEYWIVDADTADFAKPVWFKNVSPPERDVSLEERDKELARLAPLDEGPDLLLGFPEFFSQLPKEVQKRLAKVAKE